MVRKRSAERGSMLVELVTALGILTACLLPMAAVYLREQQLVRAYYWRAVAMQIVDGEMEVLRAGEWRSFGEGTQPYPVAVTAARQLPPGQFQLTRTATRLRLEWQPAQHRSGGPVAREVTVP